MDGAEEKKEDLEEANEEAEALIREAKIKKYEVPGKAGAVDDLIKKQGYVHQNIMGIRFLALHIVVIHPKIQ